MDQLVREINRVRDRERSNGQHFTYKISNGILIVASRLTKWHQTAFRISLLSEFSVPSSVSDTSLGDGSSSKMPSTTSPEDCVRRFVNHFLNNLCIAGDDVTLSFASEV